MERRERYVEFAVDNSIINSNRLPRQAFIGSKDFVSKLRQYYDIKAVSINPRLWQSYQNLGAIYFNKGERGLAKEYSQKAQELNLSDGQLQE